MNGIPQSFLWNRRDFNNTKVMMKQADGDTMDIDFIE
jgi:hypothetical protein